MGLDFVGDACSSTMLLQRLCMRRLRRDLRKKRSWADTKSQQSGIDCIGRVVVTKGDDMHDDVSFHRLALLYLSPVFVSFHQHAYGRLQCS